MAQVTVTLNGRTYRLECDDGEEQHLLTLAGEMGQHIEQLKARFGQVGDDRLLLMAGLMMADELTETRTKLEEAQAALAAIQNERSAADELIDNVETQIAGKISAAADRIQALNEQILHSGKRE